MTGMSLTISATLQFCSNLSAKLPYVILEDVDLRACLHQASASPLQQLCDDACDSVLIEINGIA